MRFFQRFFGKPQMPPRQSSKGFRKTFVLEPILTPSGLLDVDGDNDSSDFDLQPVEIPDFTPHPLIYDSNLEDLDFFGADGDPDLIADTLPDVDSDPQLDLDSTVDLASDAPDADIPDELSVDSDFEPPPILPLETSESVFERGVFTVGASGKIGVDFLYDGGGYQGELAIFNLDGLDDFDFENPEEFRSFLLEASERALSDSNLGHVAISDLSEGAKFSGNLPEGNFNAGEYMGVKTFEMNPGDRFAVMIVPNGSVQRIHDLLSAGEDLPFKLQPLFSLGTANPNDAFHLAQIADVTGDGNTFAMEDLRTDGWTDQDYNDIVFQVRGATGEAFLMDEVVNPNNDWRGTDIGQALIEYAKPYVEPDVPDLNPEAPIDSDAPLPEAPIDSDAPLPEAPIDFDLPLPESPRENQPLIGVIDTGFSGNNPDLDYSRIILGQDRVDNDANPLFNAGEGSEHGTHILGIIGATQDNGVGIDGINDTAPIWVGRAVGSGEWADSLVEFVDAAVESGQPNAVVNLSLDLTQVNPDGSVTTRYEFTPQERAAIEYARQHDVLLVVAAGNDGSVMSALGQSSQEFDNIITVGAAERANDAVAFSNAYDRVDYSSYGYGLDIMASGGSVSIPELSLTGDGVGTMAGTSVATAKVTGAVSQVWAANPGLSYRQVIEILKDTATDLKDTGWDVQSGAGLLNMAAAIHLAKATQPEEYEVLPTLIPDTWGGEGKVTPMERASFTPDEPFRLRVWPSDGVNLRNSPNFDDRGPYNIPQNTHLVFDGYAYGTVNIDPVSGEQDALYYRTWYNGQPYWVPSIWVEGYPPSRPPLLPPQQTDPNPQPNPSPQPSGVDIVYLSTDIGEILRIDTATGEQRQIYNGRPFTDIALAANGKLYGCTFFDGLFEIDPVTGQERRIGSLAFNNLNSLTFSPDGRLFGADFVNGNVFEISPNTAQMSLIGNLGGPSSGDMVFNGANEILATVGSSTLGNDRFVGLDINTGNVRRIATWAFREVYGLAFVNGQLTGYMSDGRKLAIDSNTGATNVIGTVPSYGYLWGATSQQGQPLDMLEEMRRLFAEAAKRHPEVGSAVTDVQSQGGGVFRQEFERAIMVWNGQQVVVYFTSDGASSGGPSQPDPTPNPIPKTFSGMTKQTVAIWPNTTRRYQGPVNPNGRIAASTNLVFDGYWDQGEPVWDEQAGVYDTKWFRLADGRGWVPSAYINNNPPAGFPLTLPYWIDPPTGGGSNSDTVNAQLIIDNTRLTQLLNGDLAGQFIDIDGFPSSQPYQCWDLVAYVTGQTGSTTNWEQGTNVMNNNIPVGMAIATFLGTNGAYDTPPSYNNQHTGIFAGYGNENGIDGFYIWDENWGSPVSVKKHFISATGNGVYNANNYYVIQF